MQPILKISNVVKKTLTFFLLCAGGQIAWTQSPIVVTTEAELLAAVTTDNAAIRLDADIDFSQAVIIDNYASCSLDLNGRIYDAQGALVK